MEVLFNWERHTGLVMLLPVGEALPRRATSWLRDPGKSLALSGTQFVSFCLHQPQCHVLTLTIQHRVKRHLVNASSTSGMVPAPSTHPCASPGAQASPLPFASHRQSPATIRPDGERRAAP